MPPFDDKLKAIFLLMTLPDSWETLVVSLLNNPNLTFDGVRGSILNEEIRRKTSGEGNSTTMVKGRTSKKRGDNLQRRRSKNKGKGKAKPEAQSRATKRKGPPIASDESDGMDQAPPSKKNKPKRKTIPHS